MKKYLTLSFIWPFAFALGFLYLTVKYSYFFFKSNTAWLDLAFGGLFFIIFSLITWLWFRLAFANAKKSKSKE